MSRHTPPLVGGPAMFVLVVLLLVLATCFYIPAAQAFVVVLRPLPRSSRCCSTTSPHALLTAAAGAAHRRRRHGSTRLYNALANGEEEEGTSSAGASEGEGGGGEEETLERQAEEDMFGPTTTFASAASYSQTSSTNNEEEEKELMDRVLRQVSQLRREGPLSEVLGHVPEEALGIDLMYKGQANQAFRVYERTTKTKQQVQPQQQQQQQQEGLLFIKYADDVPGINGVGTLLGKSRVRAEFHGYEELAKHMAHMVPRVFLADADEGLLISEYLADHQAFADFLARGEIGGTDKDSVPVQVAQLLGRHHGTSMENPEYETEEMRAVFSNEDHLAFWQERFVQPLLNTLRDPVAHITKPYLADTLKEVLEGDPEEAAALLWAVDSLRRSYQHKKQALVHADTHAQNILVNAQDGTAKLVDAEKSMWGPAGFDMGQFLANFAFYLAEERPDTTPQLCDCMQYAWLHYEREFMKAQAARGVDRMHTQDALRSIFNDAIGFMGLWLLFLTTSNPVEVLPFHLTDARQLEVAHANLLRMAVAALLDYKKYRTPMDLLAVPEAATEAENLLFRTVGIEEGPSGFDPEVAAVAWKRYEMGGKTRGPSMGVAGNNMQHVIEFLRAAALPLPPVTPVDPRTEEEKQAEEALYMQEMVLPDPTYQSQRADPDMFERDRQSNQWRRVPVYDEDGDEVGSVSAAKAAVMAASTSTSSSTNSAHRQELQEAEAMRIIMGERAAVFPDNGGSSSSDREVGRLEEAMLRQELVSGLASSSLAQEAEPEPAAGSFAHESEQDDLATAAAAEAAKQARSAAAAVRKAKQEAESIAAAAAAVKSDNGGVLGGDMDNMMKADGLDEDVGKLRKMLNNAWPVFFQQMNGEQETAEGVSGFAAAASSDNETQQQQGLQVEDGDGDVGEEEAAAPEEEPVEFDAFSGPSFTPFPLQDSSSRSTAPQTNRQSWASKITYRNGEGKGPPDGPGGGGGRRKKKQ